MCSKKRPAFYKMKCIEKEKNAKKGIKFGHIKENKYLCAAKKM